MKTFTLDEVIHMHVVFCNGLLHNVINDTNQRFTVDFVNKLVLTEKKGFLRRWKVTKRQTYAEVFEEDFKTTLY